MTDRDELTFTERRYRRRRINRVLDMLAYRRFRAPDLKASVVAMMDDWTIDTRVAAHSDGTLYEEYVPHPIWDDAWLARQGFTHPEALKYLLEHAPGTVAGTDATDG
ncbi:MAG TPA: hypothetical protein DIW46_01900 [Microbacterium sp.]|nr:hypothetical protein [Microbacterium sp.]